MVTDDELQDAMTIPSCGTPPAAISTSKTGKYYCDASFWNTPYPGLPEICKELGVEDGSVDCYSHWDYNDVMCDNKVATQHTLCERCTVVLARCNKNYMDPTKMDPTTKPSQQPHGKQTMYCNKCQGYVEPITFGDEKDCCPNHQRVYQSEEGPVYLYEEFNQDGEEL